MKKTLIFLAIVLSYLMPIHATNNVVVNDVTIPKGGTGTISVALNNDKNYTAFSLRLTLPEGVTYTGVTKGARMAEDHSLSGNGTTGMITCLSTANTPFTGTSGELFTITVSVSNEALVGNSLGVTLTEVYFSTTSAEELLGDVEFNVIVGEPSDGRVLLSETSTTAPEAANGVDVRVKRTINANEWSTICLPFAMSATQVKAAFGDDVQLADFTSYDTVEDTGENVVGLTVNFNMVTAMEANHPYVIKVSNAISEFTADNVTIDPEEEPCVEYDNGLTGKKRVVWGSFTGTYVADCVIPYEGDDVSLFLSGNKWWYATAQTKHMKGYRAYFWFTDLLPDVSASRIQMAFNDETANVVELKDGRMEELKSYYNLKGQRVEKPLKKGLYIRNGKKVIIK